ncbi:MAG: sugar ABC transporter permease [Clostridiales bacterium]|jgi:putative multiple sugar transport system permease protein|nr:sugar ABC transporter permease [Clostridiales bacterium]
METNQKKFKINIREYAMMFALVFVVLLFQVMTKGILLTPINITNLIQQNSYVMILACGMLLCILTGGNVDLSVGSVAGFIGAVSAVFILKMDMAILPAILISLGIGLLIGMWQGWWIAYVGVPPFIATLAGMLIFRGLTMVTLKGTSLAPLPAAYNFIAAGFIADPFSAEGSTLNILAIIAGVLISIYIIVNEFLQRKSQKKYGFATQPMVLVIFKLAVLCAVVNFFTYKLAQRNGLPAVLVLVAILVLIYTFITMRTTFGRHIYAFGGNAKAARLSGIKTKQVMFWVYANMGLMAALAGIVFTGRLNSATPKSGNGFEMDAIAACFIGGASTSGGVGTIIGAIVGALMMGVLNNGMAIMGVSIDWQQVIKGMVLLLAVAFDVLSNKTSRSA